MAEKTLQDGRWALTGAALDRLLERLDADRETAAARYEELRARLRALFEWWGAQDASALADRALDRVAVKLLEGTEIGAASLPAYVRSVAQHVLFEWRREESRQEKAVRDVPLHEPVTEEELAALDRCLERLEAEDRKLILEYYEGTHKATRQRLAEKLGVTATALRIRAHRLRRRLRDCVGRA